MGRHHHPFQKLVGYTHAKDSMYPILDGGLSKQTIVQICTYLATSLVLDE
jgi:hypothetical protein